MFMEALGAPHTSLQAAGAAWEQVHAASMHPGCWGVAELRWAGAAVFAR